MYGCVYVGQDGKLGRRKLAAENEATVATALHKYAVERPQHPSECTRADARMHAAHVFMILDASRHTEKARQLTAARDAFIGNMRCAQSASSVKLDERAILRVELGNGFERGTRNFDGRHATCTNQVRKVARLAAQELPYVRMRCSHELERISARRAERNPPVEFFNQGAMRRVLTESTSGVSSRSGHVVARRRPTARAVCISLAWDVLRVSKTSVHGRRSQPRTTEELR